jgi:hypothetical protein
MKMWRQTLSSYYRGYSLLHAYIICLAANLLEVSSAYLIMHSLLELKPKNEDFFILAVFVGKSFLHMRIFSLATVSFLASGISSRIHSLKLETPNIPAFAGVEKFITASIMAT